MEVVGRSVVRGDQSLQTCADASSLCLQPAAHLSRAGWGQSLFFWVFVWCYYARHQACPHSSAGSSPMLTAVLLRRPHRIEAEPWRICNSCQPGSPPRLACACPGEGAVEAGLAKAAARGHIAGALAARSCSAMHGRHSCGLRKLLHLCEQWVPGGSW